MSGFLTSGRRSRFMPTGQSTLRSGARQAVPETGPDPVVVRQRGQAAAELLASAPFRLALDLMAVDANEKFENSAPGPKGSEDRDAAHAELRALDGIVTRLEGFVEDAKFADRSEADAAEADGDDGE